MITWLHLRNFRSLVDTRIEFKTPLTAIVGVNNTGKTSIMWALDFLRRLARDPLPTILQRYPIALIHAQQNSGPIEIGIGIERRLPDDVTEMYEYRIAISEELTSGTRVHSEELIAINGGVRKQLLKKDANNAGWTWHNSEANVTDQYLGDLSYQGIFQLREKNRHKQIVQFRTLLASMWLFDLELLALKQSARIVPDAILDENGGNLPAVLDALITEHPVEYRALENDLIRIIPEIHRVSLKTVQDGTKFLAFREHGLPKDVFSFQSSGGVLRTVAMLTALHLPQTPMLIAIEEPENGLHPRRLQQLVDCFRRFTRADPNNQLIFTTHSPYLVDKLDPNEILIASRNNGNTTVEAIRDLEHIKKLLEDESLGDVWFRGGIGGVPTP